MLSLSSAGFFVCLKKKKSAFCWQIISSFQEERIASLKRTTMKAEHFLLLCFWCLTDLFCRGSPSSQWFSATFELTSVKCLFLCFVWTWFDLSICQTSFVMKRFWLGPFFACRSHDVCVVFLSLTCFPFLPQGTYLTSDTSRWSVSHKNCWTCILNQRVTGIAGFLFCYYQIMCKSKCFYWLCIKMEDNTVRPQWRQSVERLMHNRKEVLAATSFIEEIQQQVFMPVQKSSCKWRHHCRMAASLYIQAVTLGQGNEANMSNTAVPPMATWGWLQNWIDLWVISPLVFHGICCKSKCQQLAFPFYIKGYIYIQNNPRL